MSSSNSVTPSSSPAPTHCTSPKPAAAEQDIINNEACEEMDPSSDSVHTGDVRAAPAATGRTTPPTSLAIMPGEADTGGLGGIQHGTR